MTSSFGAAQGAMVSATIWRSSSSEGASSLGTTQATTRSPHSGSERFQTATSATPGWAHEDALDEVGPDLLRSGGDDVGDAAGDDEPSVGVEPAGIAGGEPVSATVGPDDPPVAAVRGSSGAAWAPGSGSRLLAPCRRPPGRSRAPVSAARSPLPRAASRRTRHRSPSRSCRRWTRRWAGSASGALLPPRRTQRKTEGSIRCSAVATRATCETCPDRPAASTASASNPGMTTTGVPVTIERVTTGRARRCARAAGRRAMRAGPGRRRAAPRSPRPRRRWRHG